jgi:indolepyruvate ferredoxin oxidoreductase alpha subunit
MDIVKKLYQKTGKTILLGNWGIVRGALESGVQFVAVYPGTPASEIGDIFSYLKKANPASRKGKRKSNADFYFEYSINEKVALEAGIGASYANLKTLVAMKHFGLNVASDALMPFVYTGSKGPTVIVVADDPSCHSSGQTEENTRAFAELAHIPILEPSDPQECKDFVKLGFEISEKFNIPIMIRITARVAHQSSIVKLGQIKKPDRKPGFIKDYKKFVTMPPRVLEMHEELLEKIERIREFSEKSEINKIVQNFHLPEAGKKFKIDSTPPFFEKKAGQNSKFGVVTSGVNFLYVQEALDKLDLKIPVLKLGFFYPLAEKKINKFIKGLNKVLIIEELEPYLEKEITVLAKDINPKLEILGKNLLPQSRELRPELVTFAIAKLANKKFRLPEIKLPVSPRRFPSLCAGCPYWFVFNGVKEAIKESDFKKDNIIFGGGIGCYMLASFAPHEIQDYLLCMGSSIGIAHGIKKASSKQKLIAFIGDSSFFHAGIPALINIVHNQSNPLIIVMDNQTTAMTGQQPHPGIKEAGKKEPGIKVKIEEIVKACGVKNLEIINPVKDYQRFVSAIKGFLKKDKLGVIIARSPCIRIKK